MEKSENQSEAAQAPSEEIGERPDILIYWGTCVASFVRITWVIASKYTQNSIYWSY